MSTIYYWMGAAVFWCGVLYGLSELTWRALDIARHQFEVWPEFFTVVNRIYKERRDKAYRDYEATKSYGKEEKHVDVG